MKIEILASPESVARRSAQFIAEQARATVAARGRFILGLSGGQLTPPMLRELSGLDVPWNKTELFQVDERIAPKGHADRNLTAQSAALREAPIPQDHFHPMPVEAEDVNRAAAHYAELLRTIAGSQPVLDLAHLGLGPDGHTASLVPGDPVLNVSDVDVALTGEYRGRRRMTLTYPVLNRSRCILWVVTGGEKTDALARLLKSDVSIPAGRIRSDNAVLIADKAAAGNSSVP